MSKTSGLGQRLFVSGVNVSGDIGSIDNCASPLATLDATDITQLAMARLTGLKDGALDYTAFFDPAPAASHSTFSALPTTDVHELYCTGTAAGAPAAGMVAKQIGYDGKRGSDGAFTFTIASQANGYGLEWGRLLTSAPETCANSLTGANATFEGGIGTWVLNANATIAASGAQARTGAGSLAITSTSSTTMSARHATTVAGVAVVPGRSYLGQAWFRAAASPRTCRLVIAWYDAGGGTLSTSGGSGVTDSTSAWTLATGLFTAPATAAFAAVIAEVQNPGGAAEVHYVDDVAFIPQPAAVQAAVAASTTFGLQAYLQVTSFTGTDATIKLQESSDNAATEAFADVTGGAFATVTTTGAQRIATSGAQTIKQYLRTVVTTAAGFESLNYTVMVVRNPIATVF